jgi:hypothetical protein
MATDAIRSGQAVSVRSAQRSQTSRISPHSQMPNSMATSRGAPSRATTTAIATYPERRKIACFMRYRECLNRADATSFYATVHFFRG